jgi:Molybdopterin-binding domain of aldehyde dehydrogenase
MIGTVVGVYDIPAAYVSIDAVLSNTSPTAPYRGAGPPEAMYLIERAKADSFTARFLLEISPRRSAKQVSLSRSTKLFWRGRSRTWGFIP